MVENCDPSLKGGYSNSILIRFVFVVQDMHLFPAKKVVVVVIVWQHQKDMDGYCITLGHSTIYMLYLETK